MPAALSLTETQTITVLRTFLVGILPAGIPVIRTEINRVPEPEQDNFVTLTPALRSRLATNVVTYTQTTLTDGAQATEQSTQVTIQIDVHGPDSADNAQIISTMLRDSYACDQFAASGYPVQPLYASDPRQLVFMDGEQQQEMRWSVDAVLQANPVVSVPTQTANVLTTGVIPADVTYPP